MTTKEEFLQTWVDRKHPNDGFGFVISARPPPASVMSLRTASGSEAISELTISEQMSVRGAFFPLLIPVFIAIISAIAQAVAVVVSTIVTLVGSIIAGIGQVLAGFGQLFSGLFAGVFEGLKTGLGFVIKGIGVFGKALATTFNSLHGALLGGIQGVAGNIPFLGPALSSLTSSSAFSGALKLGLLGFSLEGMGVVLEKIGISPKITQTLISGGKIAVGLGMLATGNPVGIAGALGLLGGGTSELLSLHTSLSTVVTNIIGIGAAAVGAFAGGIPGPGGTTLTGLAALKAVAPHLSMDLALSGLNAVGSKIGLSPMVSSLISVPISVGIGIGFDSLSYAKTINASSIMAAVKNGLAGIGSNVLGGLISVGASISLNEIGVPLIARSFIGGFFDQMAAGSAGGSSGSGNFGQTILSKIGDGLQKFGQGLVNAVGNVISFGQKAVEGVGNITAQGFKKAISAFSSIFSRETQESIYQDEIGLRQATVTTNGNIWTWQNGTSRVDYNTQTGAVDESFGVGGRANITGLSQDQTGNFYHQTLSYETAVGNGATLRENYENGRLQDWSYRVQDEDVLTLKCSDSLACMTKEGSIGNADVEVRNPSMHIPGPEPELSQLFVFDNIVLRLNIFEGKIAEASVEAEPAKVFQEGESKRLDKELYVLVNGIDPEQTKQSYMNNLRSDLATQSQLQVNPLKDVVVPLVFSPSGVLGWAVNFLSQNNAAQLASNIQKLVDVLRVLNEQKTGAGQLTQDVKDGVDAFAQVNGLEQLVRPMVGVAYSGGFVPLVEAAIEEGYNVSSFVALGGGTIAVGALLANGIVGLIQQMEKIATARDQVTREAYKTTFGILGIILKNMPGSTAIFAGINLFLDQLDVLYDLLNQGNFQQKVQEVYDGLRSIIQQISGYTWGPIESTNAGLMVNVWGSEDPLAKIGVSGYRTNIGGYNLTDRDHPLFNIEIEGANHYDYINHVSDYSDPADIARNEKVSKFVARLILNSRTAEDLTAFLEQSQEFVTIIFSGPNTYKIELT